MRRGSAVTVSLVVVVLVAAACSGGSSDEGLEAVEGSDTSEPSEPTVTLPDYATQALSLEGAPDDRSLPPDEPGTPTGSYGFSRYVYTQVDGDVFATLVEGPRGQQVRCQDVEQDCSYSDLKALYESGAEVPDYLGMTRDELGTLVAQLDAVNVAVNEYPTLEDACAAGFYLGSSQNPNMGIHVINPNGTSVEFDPSRPQMVLYAKEGGEKLTQAEQGQCVDGAWTGEPGYESVGAVFTLPLTEEHPEGFAGPIDNWHIHYNTCAGSPEEGGITNKAVLEADTRQGFSRAACEAAGGSFMDIIPTWMMHAYADPDYDAQGGVFSMWNPNIWPIADSPEEIRELRTEDIDGATTASINNFDFGDISAEVGERIVFSNSDSVPHTVTAGSQANPTGEFDSGLLGTGDTFALEFDAAGEYTLFCALHPAMTATIDID